MTWRGPAELKPIFARDKSELDAWYDACVENIYGAPERFEEADTVIDLGTRTGAFSFLANTRGSRAVYAYEIDPKNAEAAMANLSPVRDGVRIAALHPGAVVRGDEHRAPRYTYAGIWNSFSEIGSPVPSKSLDEIIEQVCAPEEDVRFLKVSLNGAEYPVLYTCKQIRRVREVSGKYAEIGAANIRELSNLPYELTGKGLQRFFEENGFHFSSDATMFHAMRRGLPHQFAAEGSVRALINLLYRKGIITHEEAHEALVTGTLYAHEGFRLPGVMA